MQNLANVSERNKIYYLDKILTQLANLNVNIGENFNGFRSAYVTFDTTANPLLSGVAQDMNISLPAFNNIKRITVASDAALTATATTIDIGPSVDFNTYIQPTIAQVNAGYDYDTPSGFNTSAQSISLTAQGGDITGGTILVRVEYIYIP